MRDSNGDSRRFKQCPDQLEKTTSFFEFRESLGKNFKCLRQSDFFFLEDRGGKSFDWLVFDLPGMLRNWVYRTNRISTGLQRL